MMPTSPQPKYPIEGCTGYVMCRIMSPQKFPSTSETDSERYSGLITPGKSYAEAVIGSSNRTESQPGRSTTGSTRSQSLADVTTEGIEICDTLSIQEVQNVTNEVIIYSPQKSITSKKDTLNNTINKTTRNCGRKIKDLNYLDAIT